MGLVLQVQVHVSRQAVVTLVLVVYIMVSLDLPLAPPITGNSSTANTIFASWDVDPNAVRYNVSLSALNMVDVQQQTGDGNVTFEGLVPATTYTLTVRGVDSLDRGGDPTVVTITTDRTGELAYCMFNHYMHYMTISQMCLLQVL